MKTKDEIREAEMYSILRKHKLPLKKREDLMVDLTDFTHSQLKEQQEEINYLKSECDRLNLLEEVRYDEHGNVVEFPLSMYYTPDFGCQKYPQESYESDLEQYEQSKTAQQLIKEQQKEIEKLTSATHGLGKLLQSKQKEVERLNKLEFYDDQPRKGSVDYLLMEEKLQSKEKELKTALEIVRALKNELKLQNKTAYTWNLISKAEELLK
jgi:hypothetical protein